MTDGGGPAPDGATTGDETGAGVDNASAASINAPAEHPGDAVTGNPDDDSVEAASDRALPDNEVLAGLVEAFPEAAWSLSGRQDVVTIPPERLGDFARAAKEAGFEVCADVTAVDWFRQRRTRFDVVVNLLSQRHRLRLRVIAPVGGDEPVVPSMTPIWPGANFSEREAYDMFGIHFEGHPDLTRILMPDDWEGYPLRKDFSTGSVPVQFKGSHKVT